MSQAQRLFELLLAHAELVQQKAELEAAELDGQLDKAAIAARKKDIAAMALLLIQKANEEKATSDLSLKFFDHRADTGKHGRLYLGMLADSSVMLLESHESFYLKVPYTGDDYVSFPAAAFAVMWELPDIQGLNLS